MKKLTVILSIVAAASVSYGQGFVNFANGSATGVSTNAALDINGASTGKSGTGLTTGSTAAPQGYYYALLMQSYSGSGATVATTIQTLLTTGWTFTGAQATNALGAGRLGGGATAATSSADIVGNANQFIIAGWSSNLGSSWAAVSSQLQSGNWSVPLNQTGYFGISAVGTGTGQANTSPEALFSGSGITTATTLFVVPTPEPTTMALAGLGSAALLMFRRRNK